MNNQEKAIEIATQVKYLSDFPHNLASEEDGALRMAEWKDQQFKEYIEERLTDIIFECIEEYKKLKGSLNDDGTLRSDYQLAQNIAITCETKIINELFNVK